MVSRFRRVLLDVTPLRDSAQYRLLYFGLLVSQVGRQVTVVAVPYQAYVITESSLVVGLVSLAQLGPLLIASVIGGAIADAVDRRKLLLLTQLALAGTSVALALNAMLPSPALWPLFVFSALNAAFSAVDAPTREAAVPNLVQRSQLASAYALQQIGLQLAQVLGPAMGGLVIARASLAAAYWIDVGTFVCAVVMILGLRPMPPHGGGRKVGLASIIEGFQFLKGRRVLQSTFIIDLNAMVFGMPRALFPELGTTVFGGGAATVGLLYAAPGVGAAISALTSGWVSRVHRQGRAVLIAVAGWGVAITLFGLTSTLWLGLLMLAIAGGADVLSAVFRNVILQLRVPDRLRGRLSAVQIAVVTGGPRLGDFEAGAVAALTSARFSVVSGGVACTAGVVLLHLLVPSFDRVTATDDEIEEASSG